MMNKFVQSLLLVFISFLPVARASDDSLVTVINPDESFPGSPDLIARQSFTGNDPQQDCSYYELLEKAKNTAITLGANVVRINKHHQRSQKQFCDELNVSFYHVDDVTLYEKRISWTSDRRLSWDDFKGNVPSSAAKTTAAITSCGIAIETNTVRGDNPVKVYVFNTFITNNSWVRPEHKTNAVLRHEQGHFDICELYTRKMKERFSRTTLSFNNMQSVIRDIYNSTLKEYNDRQQQYESETQHGIIDEAQGKWSALIAQELQETDVWKSR